jgi:wyosine [tRNA(Phe)-imidazoG37] synthetase (radical SAM superfamily)
MPMSQSRKEESYNNLCEDLLKERAAVLSRAGFAVEDALDELASLDRIIREKTNELKLLMRNGQNTELQVKRDAAVEEINLFIEKFNSNCNIAQLKYYYLIVTREALSLRRHDILQEIYRIPAKKKKIKVN